jgi:hypothetical protein
MPTTIREVQTMGEMYSFPIPEAMENQVEQGNDPTDDGCNGREIFERLISCKRPGESHVEFCRRGDIPYSTYHGWLKRGFMPRARLLAIVHMAGLLKARPSWLTFGPLPEGRHTSVHVVK